MENLNDNSITNFKKQSSNFAAKQTTITEFNAQTIRRYFPRITLNLQQNNGHVYISWFEN